VDERYLRQVEAGKPLALEVIEDVQEAIWSSVSSSLRGALRPLVNLALDDERPIGSAPPAASAVPIARPTATAPTAGPAHHLRTHLRPRCPPGANARRLLAGGLADLRPLRAADLREHVGMHRSEVCWAYGVCSDCDTWLCFVGLPPRDSGNVTSGS
jgi:hypothetical protein